MKNEKEKNSPLLLVLKGYCMGIADLIPGISGGTIALIAGIYEELIDAIKSLNVKSVTYLLTGKFKDAFAIIKWKFLFLLVSGIALAILSLSHLLEAWLTSKPQFVYSFFFGLILSTIPLIMNYVKVWTLEKRMLALISTISMFYIVSLSPVQTPENLLFIFFCGALGISAMILPGISGSFILLILGKYQYIIESINDKNFLVLAVFACGMFVGIVSFVRVLSFLLNKYHDYIMSILTGVVIGSLYKIWPWKKTISSIIGRHNEVIPVQQMNILPEFGIEFGFCFWFMVMGFVSVLFLGYKEEDIKD